MGERLLCKQEVIGSIPFTSTTRAIARGWARRAGCGRRLAGAGWAVAVVD